MKNHSLIYYICFRINNKITGKESYIKHKIGFTRILHEKEFKDIQNMMAINLANSLNIPIDYINSITKREYDLRIG